MCCKSLMLPVTERLSHELGVFDRDKWLSHYAKPGFEGCILLASFLVGICQRCDETQRHT